MLYCSDLFKEHFGIIMLITSVQELCENIAPGKSLICFDHGQRKIGVAISTSDLAIALPLIIIEEPNPNQHLKKCLTIIKEKDPAGIVIGLPVNMDGSEGPQAISARKFAESISLKTTLPIYLQDERMTTRAADNLLKTMGLKRQKRNQSDDLAAASMTLETVLNLVRSTGK